VIFDLCHSEYSNKQQLLNTIEISIKTRMTTTYDNTEAGSTQGLSMEVNPRLKYPAIKRSLEEFAATQCTHLYANGLNDLFVTDTPKQYLARLRTEPDAEGVAQPVPKPATPAKPARLANNASHTALSLYNDDKENHESVAKALVALRMRLIDMVGPTIRDELSDDGDGLAGKKLAQILQHVYDKHGKPTIEDLRVLRAQLGTHFSSAAQFDREAAIFKRTIARLATHGDATSEPQKQQLFEAATKSVLGIPPIIARYKRVNPEVEDMSLAGMIQVV
jgi:hypothetical protein